MKIQTLIAPIVVGGLLIASAAVAQSESFDRVVSSGPGEVEIVLGENAAYEDLSKTRRGEDAPGHMEFEVSDGVLKVTCKKTEKSGWGGGNCDKDIRHAAKVTLPDLKGVTLSGSGDIIFGSTFEAEDFDIRLSGSGDIDAKVEAESVDITLAGSGDVRVSGETDALDVSIAGSGDVRASKLDAKNVNVRIAGSGDARVVAEDSLSARISGSGDVRYKGDPSKLNTTTNGSGDVSRL